MHFETLYSHDGDEPVYNRRCFQTAELAELQQRFDSAAGAGGKLDVRGLQQAFGIAGMDPKLAARLHVAVCRGDAAAGASLDDVVIANVSPSNPAHHR